MTCGQVTATASPLKIHRKFSKFNNVPENCTRAFILRSPCVLLPDWVGKRTQKRRLKYALIARCASAVYDGSQKVACRQTRQLILYRLKYTGIKLHSSKYELRTMSRAKINFPILYTCVLFHMVYCVLLPE